MNAQCKCCCGCNTGCTGDTGVDTGTIDVALGGVWGSSPVGYPIYSSRTAIRSYDFYVVCERVQDLRDMSSDLDVGVTEVDLRLTPTFSTIVTSNPKCFVSVERADWVVDGGDVVVSFEGKSYDVRIGFKELDVRFPLFTYDLSIVFENESGAVVEPFDFDLLLNSGENSATINVMNTLVPV